MVQELGDVGRGNVENDRDVTGSRDEVVEEVREGRGDAEMC